MIVHATVDPHSARMKSNESIAAISHRYGTREVMPRKRAVHGGAARPGDG
jgi:hypothetical protein